MLGLIAGTVHGQHPGAPFRGYSGVGQQQFYRQNGVPAAPAANRYDEEADEGEEDSVEARLKKLEETIADQKDALSGLKSDIGKKVSSGNSGSKMKVSGRVHVDYWGFPESDPGLNLIEYGDPDVPPQARLNFRRMRFGVSGSVLENMEYKIEMEFAGGNNSEFRDAYLGFNELPILQTVLIGNQKRPYGLDHLNSSRYNVFIERPFVIEAFNEDARRLGVCAYGVSENEAWNWRYGIFNQENIQSTGNYVNNTLQLQAAARLANTIWYDETSDGRGYAHWAVSGTYAQTDPDGNPAGGISPNQARFRTRPEARTSQRWLNTDRIDGADDYGLMGFEAVLNVGALQIVGEYQNIWLSRVADEGLFFHGAYVYASYFLTGEHMPWERYSGTLGRPKPFENFFLVERCRGGIGGGWGAWQLAARLSYADFNDQDIFGGRGEAFTAALNWYWTPYARMQFNYIVGDVENRDVEIEVDDDVFETFRVDGTYHIFGTRFMIDF
jgi:phosphate-selective porin OprO/OprP